MRNITFAEIENFRDLGGYPCSYGVTSSDVIYRSGSLFYGNDDDQRKVHELGIQTIFDLRGARIANACKHPFIAHEHITLIPIEIPNSDAFPKVEEEVPGWYMSFISDPYVSRQFFQNMLRCRKPMLFHCEAGKDRTGAFAAVVLLANGVSKEDVCRDYLLSYDGRLAKTEQRTLKEVPGLQRFVFHPNPKTIAHFIDMFFERYGTTDDYFECMGLTDDEINALSNILGVAELSAGAVVFHENKVLVEHMKLGHYSMPKGHIESEDKDLIATAKREIKEETGLTVDIDSRFEFHTNYSPRPGRIKEVVWFIAETKNKKFHLQEEEVQDCYFLSPADAMRVLTHEDDRRVLAAACEYRYK